MSGVVGGPFEKVAPHARTSPAFGRPVGVVINYSPDQAMQFDLTGKPIAIFDKAHRLGRAHFSIGGYLRPTMVLGSDTDDAGSFL